MSAITLYGIPNCDTVKRARAWLAARDVAVGFHDFKKQGVPAGALARWADAVGWETLLNRRGTTWRRLTEAERDGVADAASALALMQSNSSLIKRPVVEWADGTITVGFDAGLWTGRIGR